jgi:hypothetical protein
MSEQILHHQNGFDCSKEGLTRIEFYHQITLQLSIRDSSLVSHQFSINPQIGIKPIIPCDGKSHSIFLFDSGIQSATKFH